jgi:circadian clock protein KaiC
MLGGGYFRGSTILVSGGAGCGKTSVAACLASTLSSDERALYFSFEESPAQLVRNLSSIGVNLASLVNEKRLRIISTRPSGFGLEAHLFVTYEAIVDFEPSVVILDPITDFAAIGNKNEIRAMMTRLVDHLKTKRITALLTSAHGPGLAGEGSDLEADAGISSLIDTWIVLQNCEVGDERKRALSVRKSRGTAHSNQIREFVINGHGLSLVPTLVPTRSGTARFVTSAAREAEPRLDAGYGGDNTEGEALEGTP